MSTALAIAAVTAVLKDLLNNRLIDGDLAATVGEVKVTSLPPDRIDVSEGNEKNQLNLFLYQVTPNPGWRNVGLPSRDANGERTANPPLALDLHYLLSAYGTRDLHPEILLGYGMQLLHETPVLARDAIRRSLHPPLALVDTDLPAELQSLFDAQLSEQIEQIKIVPQALTTEEISRLWTAFQARYRPTGAYQASVVLIESRQTRRTPLPVSQRNLYVRSLRHPFIDEVASQVSPSAPVLRRKPILSGHRLVLEGRDLRSGDTVVSLDGQERSPTAIEDAQVTLDLTPEIPAGVHGIQVVHRLLMGSPPEPHLGFNSNIVAFVLRPRTTTRTVTDVQILDHGLRAATITVGVDPAVVDFQRVVLLLHELDPAPGRAGVAYSFAAPQSFLSPPGIRTSVAIPISGALPGDYLVRIQVDGAESVLELDASGAFVGPTVTIP